MTQQEKKLEFIKLRGQGMTYDAIAEQLGIAKSTCTAWNKELEKEIAAHRRDQLEELQQAYYMTKERRIERLGETLRNINDALSRADLSKLSPDRLLDFKLKYTKALKDEYTPLSDPIQVDLDTAADDLMNLQIDLINRFRAGELTEGQATKELNMIRLMIDTYSLQSDEIIKGTPKERRKEIDRWDIFKLLGRADDDE
ncbi:MAG: hypothetical protein WCY59_03550 [Anaerovoracaceae bacterium]|mgnify:CR=1 FL=1|jgi:transposase